MVPAGVALPPKSTAVVQGVGEESLPSYSTTSKNAATRVASAGGSHCMEITWGEALAPAVLPLQYKTDTPEAP